MKKSISVLAGLIVTSFAFSGCATLNDPVDSDRIISVEASLYSGKPNPRWILDADEQKEFSKKMDKLPERTPGMLPLVETMGFNGYNVTIVTKEEGESSTAKYWVRTDGIVTMLDEYNEPSVSYVDTQKTISSLLRKSGEDDMEAQEFTQLPPR